MIDKKRNFVDEFYQPKRNKIIEEKRRKKDFRFIRMEDLSPEQVDDLFGLCGSYAIAGVFCECFYCFSVLLMRMKLKIIYYSQSLC